MGHGLRPIFLAVALIWCIDGHSAVAADEGTLELVADGLDFPANFATSPDHGDRVFIVDYYDGKIFLLENGVVRTEPFLDIQDILEAEREITTAETGLISLAFPPGNAKANRVYVTYTGQGNRLVLSRFALSEDGSRAIRSSEEVILSVENWAGEHHCGHLEFGPDGLLYLCIGDSGRTDAAQDPGVINGSILRIDVEKGQEPYAVPADNPFVGVSDARPEIWAYGVRNPWRFSIDGANGDLYVPDPGSRFWEELTVLPKDSSAGANLGWGLAEGNECREECSLDGLVWPSYAYPYGEGRCSIIGGATYRGEKYPEWNGVYVFGDFCTGDLWGIRDVHAEPKIRKLVSGDATGDPRSAADELGADLAGATAVGVGPDNEILITNGPGGSVYRLHFPADFETGWHDVGGLQLADLMRVARSGSGVASQRMRGSRRWRWTQPIVDLRDWLLTRFD